MLRSSLPPRVPLRRPARARMTLRQFKSIDRGIPPLRGEDAAYEAAPFDVATANAHALGRPSEHVGTRKPRYDWRYRNRCDCSALHRQFLGFGACTRAGCRLKGGSLSSISRLA